MKKRASFVSFFLKFSWLQIKICMKIKTRFSSGEKQYFKKKKTQKKGRRKKKNIFNKNKNTSIKNWKKEIKWSFSI